jgi:hypothetical protein
MLASYAPCAGPLLRNVRPQMRGAMKRLMWIALALMIGCAKDRRGPSSVCQVHHVQMRSVIIGGFSATVDAGPTYEDAHAKFFPNGCPSSSPKERIKIYMCDECVRAQREWLQIHK